MRYLDSVTRALHVGSSRRTRPARPPRLRGRRATFVPVRDESLRGLSF
ncbi:hypothetical protein [Microbacterium ulmi]|uniref:Uncharacterized protein n=1 Tax=Microbacterium ulmi TaxID=179095 RepID=A0A7Y2LZI0_9MICO|nr:hypothetical protein [Microbacterium ulmi]NII69171.1 hypothetical protein [Microbacterium ulmi]NNH03711.1 hypothetical protein [Microbacterium ulmi]